MNAQILETADHLLSPDEVAQRLQIEAGTLAAWRSRNSQPLPFVKVGNRVRYRPADVAQFIDSRLIA